MNTHTFSLSALLSTGWSGNSSSNNRIAEVVYDASIGTWGYMHLRKGTHHVVTVLTAQTNIDIEILLVSSPT